MQAGMDGVAPEEPGGGYKAEKLRMLLLYKEEMLVLVFGGKFR